jgi:type I restriction enzyme M protein
MLDSATKRRIDTARDILVGKVPDPKSQVEQITIALIYKFMDDMDAESEEMGGKRKFFTDEFARYGWAKLMSPSIGGHEMLGLYGEGIDKMPENPGIPPLFRDIFKNAYLPYRDPETLKAFLKIIDEFSYDHSERLGDAFEYLLSVLGSQGDAGQFRTPRHIIDFMVEIIDPKKTETVLDPACGTAGFLISSYKHILDANRDAKGRSKLTPDEKGRLAKNFQGYDISPDMVRLSLVNLYLHGFNDPHIYEYDTLTSEERWNQFSDVIMANPPFMSPKGGIKPHKRFSVQSKRSEVLFVDYMAEHLTPLGRAAIIVPEGIIFQSQSSYTELRQMLVENSLVAVVSLPAGVFNPYSGVKTSILILDRSVARQADSIAFFKVENDGFGLGAQRRVSQDNDLPQVKAELRLYLDALRSGHTPNETLITMGIVVSKAQLAANGDYNLSGDRYRKKVEANTQWPLVPLSELCEFRSGLWKGDKEPLRIVKILRNTNFTKSGHLNLEDVAEHPVEIRQLESRLLQYGDILLEKSGGGPAQPVGRVALFNVRQEDFSYSNFTTRIRVTDGRANSVFVWLILNEFYRQGKTESLQKQTSGIRNLDNSAYQALNLPLPPLDIQNEIVAEIEGYQRVIDGARAVLDSYRPHIPIRPEWPLIKLSDICSFKNGLNFSTGLTGHSLKIIGVGDFQKSLNAPVESLKQVHLEKDLGADYLVKEGDIIFVRSNGNPDLVGRSIIVPAIAEAITFSGFTIRARFEDAKALPIFYAHLFKSRDFAEMIKTVGQGAGIRNLSQRILSELTLPLPPLKEQKEIVAEIEAEQTLVAANSQLITRLEKKSQGTLARVWGQETAVGDEA